MNSLQRFKLCNHIIKEMSDTMEKNYNRLAEDNDGFDSHRCLWKMKENAMWSGRNAAHECMELDLSDVELKELEDLVDHINAKIDWLS